MTAQNASSLPPAPKQPPAVMRFFSNPIVGILGALASIIGVPLAIYFYVQATQFRELVYYANPAQAIVVKAGEVSKLRVLIGDRELKSDVTTAQIAIWNRGNESLKPENVVAPVVIRTVPSVPILEAKIRTKSRDAIGLTLDEAHLEEGILGLSWKILEQGDGGVIQLVYAGNPDKTKIAIDGAMEGQRSIRQLQYSGTILSVAEQVREQRNFAYVGWMFVVTTFVLIGGLILTWRHSPRVLNIFGIFAIVVTVGAAIYWFLQSRIPEPPFGF